MITPEEVAKRSKGKEDENLRFRSYLKGHAEEEKLDEQFFRLHKELFDGYDCSKCRNCCKMYHCSIPTEDLGKTALALHITKEQLIEYFLRCNEITGDYETKHMPCDFLTEENSCRLGEARPESCRDYPYTNCPDRLGSLYSMLGAVEVCPVAYEIWERLKQEYGFRTGRRR